MRRAAFDPGICLGDSEATYDLTTLPGSPWYSVQGRRETFLPAFFDTDKHAIRVYDKAAHEMFAPGIVIYEKNRRWESILKRSFLRTRIQVRPCRLPAQLLDVLGAMPGSVAVIDLSAGAAQGLRLITQIGWRHPQCRTLVVAPASLADLEWPAREFGAAAFLSDSITDKLLGQLCRRQLGFDSPFELPPTDPQEM